MEVTNIIQINICVNATAPTPRTFPIISCVGLIEDTIISTTLLVFSSRTLCKMKLPYIKTNIYIKNPLKYPRPKARSELDCLTPISSETPSASLSTL